MKYREVLELVKKNANSNNLLVEARKSLETSKKASSSTDMIKPKN
jgi:hypothetical protein